MRTRRWPLVGALVAFAVMAGALAVFGVAYAQQADKVDELEAQNQRILGDHKAIGKQFAQQTRKLAQQSKELETAVRLSYGQGFLAGQRAKGVPAVLAPLVRYVAFDMLIPRRVPSVLRPRRPRTNTGVDGYVLRWRDAALFASRTDPLSVWTRQALGGLVHTTKVGPRRVRRLTGPSGVIYAWREKGTTYALLAVPRLESAARALIASMK